MAKSAVVATRRSRRNVQKSENEISIKEEESTSTLPKATKRAASSSTPDRKIKRLKTEKGTDALPNLESIKSESPNPEKSKKGKATIDKATELQTKKLKAYTQFSNSSPFPDFHRPTPAECKQAHKILAALHGDRTRPEVVTAPTNRAGCGDSSSVLDALVRTILSQNTSDKNSTRAKLNMDNVYGGSDKWDAIVSGGQAKLQKAIESGGLSVTKSKAIISILQQAKAKYGIYSLDHLFQASNEEAMKEMLAFQGVGPKTASCVLLFCLKRDSFAVDTHVHRITGLLGWRPKDASRDEAHAHLDARIPGEEKYALHILFVTHGKTCAECKAGGKNIGKCDLRKAFRDGKVKRGATEDAEMAEIKAEESEIESDKDGISCGI